MSLNEIVKQQILTNGSTVSFYDNDDNLIVKTKAIVQPLRYKNKMYMQSNVTELGVECSDYYTIRVQSDIDLDMTHGEGYIKIGDDKYYVTKSVDYIYSDEIVYKWAVIKR